MVTRNQQLCTHFCLNYGAVKGQFGTEVKAAAGDTKSHYTKYLFSLRGENKPLSTGKGGHTGPAMYLGHVNRSVWPVSSERPWTPSIIYGSCKINERKREGKGQKYAKVVHDEVTIQLQQQPGHITSDGFCSGNWGFCFIMYTWIHRYACTQIAGVSKASYVTSGIVQWRNPIGIEIGLINK